MKFAKLTGENFKNYDHFEFEPEKTTTAFVGNNGRGKTTITQMIRFGLTGDSPKEVIQNGKDKLRVSMEFNNGSVVERTQSLTNGNKVKVNGKNCTGKALSAHIESISGVPMESIKLSSSSELIENMKPEEFGDFIMTYIPEQLDFETVKDYMGAVTPEVLSVISDDSVMPQTKKFGYDQIQKTYEYLFEERKIIRSTLSTYESKIKGVKMEPPESTVDEIDKQLEDILKKEGGIANAQKAIDIYTQAKKAKARQEEQIALLEDKISKIGAKRPDPNVKSELESKKASLTASIVSLKSTTETIKKNIETFKETLTNLNSPRCPLSEGLVCKTDKTEKKEEFEKQIKDNETALISIQSEIKTKQDEFDNLAVEEKKFSEQEKAYLEKILLNKQLEELKKTVIVLPEKPASVEISISFEEEKRKLHKLKEYCLRYEQFIKDYNYFITLKNKKEIYDTLVQLFAPKGEIALKVTKHYFGVFEDLCNERANELKPGFTLKFVPENGIKILCEVAPGKGYIPYWACSSGEKAFVIFLLTDLISNALTKSNIMILDDLDKLDNEAFESLISCIMQPSIQDAYDHIFICAVNHTDTLEILKKYADIDVKEI